MPLLQNKDCPSDMFHGMGKHLKIWLTNECNMYCKHCYTPTENYKKENNQLINHPEWIERLCNNKIITSVHLQGGEPTLRLDEAKMCADIARKYGKLVAIFTNGKRMDEEPEVVEFIEKEVRPNMIIMSFNKYLEEQCDQARKVNKFAAHYKDNPTIYFGTTAIIDSSNPKAFEHFIKAGGWPPYDPNYYPELEAKLDFDYWKFQLPICSSGRIISCGLDADVPRMVYPNCMHACDFSIACRCDGVLQADCGFSGNPKVILGHIDLYDKENPVADIMRRRQKKFWFIEKPLNGFYEYCREHDEITCLTNYPEGFNREDYC